MYKYLKDDIAHDNILGPYHFLSYVYQSGKEGSTSKEKNFVSYTFTCSPTFKYFNVNTNLILYIDERDYIKITKILDLIHKENLLNYYMVVVLH